MKVVLYVIILLVITMAYSCHSLNNKAVNKEVKISNKEYNRDSIFIEYTINQFIENKYRGYDFYDSANSKIYIDTILYSPDKLKLFSLVIIEKRKIEQGKPFHGMAVIAYREDTSGIWKIYPIDKYSVSWNDYVGSRSVIRRCYFHDLKKSSTHRGEFNYTPLEDSFWGNKGLYFKKGLDIDTLYFFQTEYNFDSKKYDKIIPYLEIDYPKEMIELYRGSVPKR